MFDPLTAVRLRGAVILETAAARARGLALAGALAVASAAGAVAAPSGAGAERLAYPPAPRGDEVDRLGDLTLPDPYRRFETWDDPAVAVWLAGQKALVDAHIRTHPARERIERRIAELLDIDSVTPAVEAGGLHFFTRIHGLRTQNLGVLHVGTQPYRNAREVIDVRRLYGEAATLQAYVPSPDGRWVAVLVRMAGATHCQLRVVEVATGGAGDAVFEGVHYLSSPPLWARDGSGLFVLRYEPGAPAGSPGSFERLFFWPLAKARPADPVAGANDDALARAHGGPSAGENGVQHEREIEIATGDPAPGWLHTLRATEDGRWLVVTSQHGSEPKTRVARLALGEPMAPGRALVALVDRPEALLTLLGEIGEMMTFYTDFEAPNGRVVGIDPAHPEPSAWLTLVPEQKEAIAARDQTGGNALGLYGERFVLMYLRDGQPFLRLFRTSGALDREIDLPVGGSVWGGFVGRPGRREILFQFLGMTEPTTILRLDTEAGLPVVAYRAPLTLDAEDYLVDRQFYRAPDGTAVPIVVAHRTEMARDGSAPAMIYGYGALGWVSFVWYQPHLLAWLEMGGVYAQPSLRGGGEYGARWHEAALRERKEVAIGDYIAAAEWLVARRYSAAGRVVANGGSLSGPVGATAALRRPDLFGAAVIDRPLVDLVRYERHGFASSWATELGSASNPAELSALVRRSPYEAALASDRPCAPPTLVLAGELDRTTPPFHGAKLAAALQARGDCDRAYLFHLMRGAGHNFGRTPETIVESFTTWITFLVAQLGLDRGNQAREESTAIEAPPGGFGASARPERRAQATRGLRPEGRRRAGGRRLEEDLRRWPQGVRHEQPTISRRQPIVSAPQCFMCSTE